MIKQTEYREDKEDLYSQNNIVNHRISELHGLSVRKAANLIHNSLMLVENPDDINYNTTARLYKLLIRKFEEPEQKKQFAKQLKDLLIKYASEDRVLGSRLKGLSNFNKQRLADRATKTEQEDIESEDDLAADVMANVVFNTARANTNYAKTLRPGNPHLYLLANKYTWMRPGLKKRGIILENALETKLTRLDSDFNPIYKSPVAEFRTLYTKKKMDEDEVEAQVTAIGDNGEKTVIATLPSSFEESDEAKLELMKDVRKRGEEDLETRSHEPVGEKNEEWDNLVSFVRESAAG